MPPKRFWNDHECPRLRLGEKLDNKKTSEFYLRSLFVEDDSAADQAAVLGGGDAAERIVYFDRFLSSEVFLWCVLVGDVFVA